MENKLEDLDLTTFAKLFDIVIEFAVAYGFQILGAIVVLLIGLKVASWCARKTTSLAEAKGVDVTLSRFIGNAVRLVVVVAVVIVTLGNFGVAIAPLIALVGASAFGVTLAIQGPLSNYGAGLAIILTRPFIVGDTITVQGASGVVEEISLGATILIGEDGERILVPNRQIVGEIIINSEGRRVVQTKVCVAYDADITRATELLRRALDSFTDLRGDPAPQIGIHDFAYGGIILGLRFWVPSQRYFEMRYEVNRAAYAALEEGGIALLSSGGIAVAMDSLSDDAPA